jgi:hypothetical protein
MRHRICGIGLKVLEFCTDSLPFRKASDIFSWDLLFGRFAGWKSSPRRYAILPSGWKLAIWYSFMSCFLETGSYGTSGKAIIMLSNLSTGYAMHYG